MRLFRTVISTCVYFLCRLCMSDFEFGYEAVDRYDTPEAVTCSELIVLIEHLPQATPQELDLFFQELVRELTEGPYLLPANRERFVSRLHAFLDLAGAESEVRDTFIQAIETAEGRKQI